MLLRKSLSKHGYIAIGYTARQVTHSLKLTSLYL